MLRISRIFASYVNQASFVFKPHLKQNDLLYWNIQNFCTNPKGGSSKLEYVLLLDQAGKVLGTKTKQDAQLIAKKHGMSLITVGEPSGKKKLTLQLKPSKEIAAQRGSSTEQRAVKNLTVSAAITDHDLETKVKNVGRWLEKDCEVRVGVTNGQSDDQLEGMFKKFESLLGESGRMLQKRIKNGVLKFIILPPAVNKKGSTAGQKSSSAKSSGSEGSASAQVV